MADTSNLSQFLTDVADAIRTKKETTEPIPAANFDSEILDITTGVMTEEEYETNLALTEAILAKEMIKVNYLKLTNTTYDTGFKPNTYYGAEIVFRLDSTPNGVYLLGNSKNVGANGYWVRLNSNNINVATGANEYTYSVTLPLNKWITLYYGGSFGLVIKYDDTTVTLANSFAFGYGEDADNIRIASKGGSNIMPKLQLRGFNFYASGSTIASKTLTKKYIVTESGLYNETDSKYCTASTGGTVEFLTEFEEVK